MQSLKSAALSRLETLGQQLMAFSTQNDPRTWVFGLARSLVALSTLLTLLFNPVSHLFRLGAGLETSVGCQDLAGMSMFCLVNEPHLEWIRWLAIFILILVIVGIYPRWTAPLHWWVAFSFNVSARITDGGDQVAANLTLLFLLIALFDPRQSHWQALPSQASTSLSSLFASNYFWQIARLQIAYIYLDACLSKLKIPEWIDGTAMYYFLNSPFMGAPDYLKFLLLPLAASVMVTIPTWSSLILEFFLGISLFMHEKIQRLLLFLGILFHLGIFFFMGISSFALVMLGALTILLMKPYAKKPVFHLNIWPHPAKNPTKINPIQAISLHPHNTQTSLKTAKLPQKEN